MRSTAENDGIKGMTPSYGPSEWLNLLGNTCCQSGESLPLEQEQPTRRVYR